MLKQIKKYVPQPIKQVLAPVYQRTFGQWEKRRLFLRMQKKHQMLLAQIKGKERIRVVFLAIHKSVWKVDPVFQKMLADPFFEPIILVCPYTVYGEERMWKDMRECLKYFSEKGYPTYSSYVEEEQRWIKLDELEPDIIFFTNPHNLTRKEYYQDAYLNYLSCYAGYGMPVSKYNNFQEQFNQNFHNSIWKIFVQTDEMVVNYQNISQRKKNGIHLVGDCLIEELRAINNKNLSWINSKNKIKIIYAPHHTIENNSDFSIATFLENSNFLKEMVIKYKDYFYWTFKPHPILQSKLYIHKDWGRRVTDEYYTFWSKVDNAQVEDGEYVDLFKESDALILDSSSFLGEYLFVNKPMLYLIKKKSHQYFSKFGAEILSVCSLARTHNEIENFLLELIRFKKFNQKDLKEKERVALMRKYDKEVIFEKKTSSNIVQIIKMALN